MATAHPLPTDDEIPASRLMRERDQARTEAAERQRRELSLIRQLEAMRIERDDARLSRDYALEHRRQAETRSAERAHENGILRERERTAFQQARAEGRAEGLRDAEAKIQKLEASVRALSGQAAEYRDELTELLRDDAVGKDCDECNGYGGTGDCADNWDACDAGCFDGRVSK